MKKGIYILPNLFTTGSLFFGFYSVVSSYNGDFKWAAISIVISAVFDTLDGKVARMTGTTSKFGVEYDSLADLISFGMAPAFLAYTWALIPFGRYGWIAAFLYVTCAALRLARFNVQVETVEKTRFKGVPSPAAAGMIALTVLLAYHLGGIGSTKHVTILLMVYFLAFLMVSNVTYRSLKELELSKRQPFSLLVVAVLLLITIITEPQIMLFAIASIYLISGPVELMFILTKRKIRDSRLSEGKKKKAGI